MGKTITLRDLFGLVKDKVSLSKAALLSKSNAAAIRVAVVRATAHSPLAPPDEHHISALLLFGEASRSTASPIIAALMDRLHRTGNCVVALKCLLIIHTIIRRGPFILQDQLSIFPSTGGHNYLKLSDFRDGATAATWALSSWVRWYARFLETLLSSSRGLGYFLCSSSFGENKEHRISSFLNVDLLKELDSLIVLIEEICKVPDNLAAEGDVLVKEIMRLLLGDYVSAVNEILLRLGEFNERLSLLSFGDSVELVCGLKRLQDCRERLSILCAVNKPSIEMMWGSVQDVKDQIGMLNRGGGKFLTWEAREIGTESARFEYRVLLRGDSVRSQSGRLSVNSVPSFLALDKSI